MGRATRRRTVQLPVRLHAVPPAPRPVHAVRHGTIADLDDIEAVEDAAFAGDRMSRRTLRRFILTPTAEFLVADQGGEIVGAALVLVRRGSDVARLYSIAVAPHAAGRGIGRAILSACEQVARRRDCSRLRLEVHETNARAIALYRRAGYREFGRLVAYYHDQGDALRFEKPLGPVLRVVASGR